MEISFNRQPLNQTLQQAKQTLIRCLMASISFLTVCIAPLAYADSPTAQYSQPASALTFAQAWQQLQQVSDKFKAETQQVNRAQAEQEASNSLSYPALDIAGSYTHLEKPIELDLRDLNPLASIDPSALPPQLGQALAAIPGSMFVTPFTEQDVFKLVY